jgi:secreted trypsin-like serine protease
VRGYAHVCSSVLLLVLPKLYTGGPLFIASASPENDVLVGIASYTPTLCSNAGIPGVYTRVSAFSDWIKETLSCLDLGACTSSPTINPTVSVSPTVSISPTVAPPSPQNLPGPTADIVTALQTDDYPDDSSLWYRNVCNGNLTILLDANSGVAPNAMKNFSVALSTGTYEFILLDSVRNG